MAIGNSEAHIPLRKQITAFVSMPDEAWQLLEPHLHETTITKGHFMVNEGERGRDIGFVLHGAMRQYYTRDGEEKTTYFFFENAFVAAYISCITGRPSLVSIEALAETKLITFPYHILKGLFEQSIYWERFGRLIAEWAMMGLEERMVGLLTQSAEERYDALLRSNKTKILERIPQHFIANYLGVTPVSLSRIRNKVSKK
jgi:CRP-like cAMP-binding protein